MDAVVEGDREMLYQMCEYNLYDRFDQGIRVLEGEGHKIELSIGSGAVDIDVIDFH